MKKVTLSVLSLLSVVVLVGCGTKAPEAPAVTNPEVNNGVEQVQENSDNVVQNNGEVAVDTAYTTKLANCLTENGVTMYGTERCGHCKNQKGAFGDGFANVNYVDCDADRQVCLDAGVRGFPTWVDADGNPYPGTQSLDRLAAIAGCEDIE